MGSNPRVPICGCGRVMRCSTTGLSVLTHTEDGAEYELWASDEFECPSCSAKVVIVNAREPIAEHWQPGFERAKRAASTPDGRKRLFKAYYRMTGPIDTIAGVQLTPAEPAIQNPPAASTVDSTTAEVQDTPGQQQA